MNESSENTAQPKRSTLLLTLVLILVGLPAWIMFYMFVIRPPLFNFIMSLIGVQSMRIPVGLHVLIVLGVPFGLAMLWDQVFGRKAKTST
jgi:hypothetical protein